MVIYFVLIIYVMLLPLIIRFFTDDKKKIQFFVALFGMIGVFLVLALKAPSVGIDIKGYMEQYNLSRKIDWFNFDYVYFEKGYIFLEKLFSKMGLPFQMFTVILYGFECFAWFKIISKFSSDSMISVLFFICYQFFVFSCSGLRQTVAMSICIMAFLLIIKWRPVPVIIGVALILLSTTIHSSAVVFLWMIIPISASKYIKKVTISEIILGLIAVLLLRNTAWVVVNDNFHKVEVGTSIQVGGNMFFLIIIALLSYFTYNTYYRIGFWGRRSPYIPGEELTVDFKDTIELRIAIVSVLAFFLLSGGKMLRAMSYFTMLLVPTLPNVFAKYKREQRFIIKTVFVIFLLYLFYTDTLAVNQLEISHYKFFWQ